MSESPVPKVLAEGVTPSKAPPIEDARRHKGLEDMQQVAEHNQECHDPASHGLSHLLFPRRGLHRLWHASKRQCMNGRQPRQRRSDANDPSDPCSTRVAMTLEALVGQEIEQAECCESAPRVAEEHHRRCFTPRRMPCSFLRNQPTEAMVVMGKTVFSTIVDATTFKA